MLGFKRWMAGVVEEGSNPGAKTGLYPLGYGGVGLYPPQWYPTRSADAILYLSIDERIYKGKEGGSFDITHIPGKVNSSMNSGEGGIWDISGIRGSRGNASDSKAANENAGSFAIVGCEDSPNYQVWGARSDLKCKKRTRLMDMKFGSWVANKEKKKNG